MASTSSSKDPALPSYLHSQMQSASIQDDAKGSSDDKHASTKTIGDDISPLKAARRDLENMLSDVDKRLSDVVKLVQANRDYFDDQRYKPYADCNLTELYDNSKPISWALLREERGRLMNQRQELQLRIIEKLEQERQQEQELQEWTKVDQMQARHLQVLIIRLQWCDQLLKALQTKHVSRITNAFKEVYHGPFGEKVQLSLSWNDYNDPLMVKQDVLAYMERLSQERNTVMLNRVNPPAGTAPSSAVLLAFSSTVHPSE